MFNLRKKISQRELILLIVFLIILITLIFFLYQRPSLESIGLSAPSVEKKVETDFDQKLFDQLQFQNLKKHGDWPVTVKPEELGRENPFEPIGGYLEIE